MKNHISVSYTHLDVYKRQVLGFIHPSTKEYMQFESPLPDYFTEIINKLKSSSL